MKQDEVPFNHPSNFTLPEQLRMHFRKKYGTQRAAALHFGVSDSMISGVAVGKFQPSEAMLKDMQNAS